MNTAADTRLADERVVVIGGSDIGITTARTVADHGGRAIVTKRPSEPSAGNQDDTEKDTSEKDGREGRDNGTESEANGGTGDTENATGNDTTTKTQKENKTENEIIAADRDHIEVCELDSTDEAAVAAFFDDIDAFDHLVCAAERVPTGGPLETDPETFREVFDAVFWGAYYAAKYGVSRLDEGNTITFVSGNAAIRPSVQFFAVGVANAAVETLTQYLAVEIGPVRVNAVSPGRGDTFGLTEDTRQSLAESVPTKRVGEPEDIADAILFAMTNQHMTGAVIRVDGGDLLV